MEASLTLIISLVILGSLVKGLAGFGFGIAATALLTNYLPAREAVTLMILPLIAVNIPLIFEAKFSRLEKCLWKYRIFAVSSIIGTLIGFLMIDSFPETVIAGFIGLMSVLYVFGKQDTLNISGKDSIVSNCFTFKWYNQSIVGSLAGIAFGVSNIGLLFVTYLSKVETDHRVFVAVLSSLLLLATGLRAALSYNAGLYSSSLLTLSIGLSFVALLTSYASAKISHKIPEKYLKNFALILILLAGLRILYSIA